MKLLFHDRHNINLPYHGLRYYLLFAAILLVLGALYALWS